MPRILSLHREEVDLGLETLKFQCVIGADPLLLVLLGGEAWCSMVASYRSSTLSTRPEGKRGGEYHSLSQGRIAHDLQTLSSIEQCEVLVFTGAHWWQGRPDVSTFTWEHLKFPFQVFLCQCSCYIAEDQQFQWLEKVRGRKPWLVSWVCGLKGVVVS